MRGLAETLASMSEPKYALDGEGPSGIVDPRRTNLITIRDVARRAQVSNSTVSRVFGPPYPSVPVRVNDETRRRVEAAAAELGYRPSLFARSLKTKRSNVIGVVVRDIANPFWAGMVQGISRTCAARGYHLALINVASRSDEA